MERSFHIDFDGVHESHSSTEPQNEQNEQTIPCVACGGIPCYCAHKHDPDIQGCPLKGCYICADLARLNDDILGTYTRLKILLEERKKVRAKPRHDTAIYRMPVEIISSIFLFLKDAIIGVKFEDRPDGLGPQRPGPPHNKQPTQSPPLLVGAVCKRWRDITMITPRVWTDVIIDLDKNPLGQFNMVRNWAHRSGRLPLDISIRQIDGGRGENQEYDSILFMLRSLAFRWHDISLHVKSAYFFHRLFNNLPQDSHIRTLFVPRWYTLLAPFAIQHALRPRHLIGSLCYVTNMPFQWDRLVFLDIDGLDCAQILHIIHHAQNLKHCIANGDGIENDLIPTDPIINRSLIYLKTDCYILHYLTLPSLLHLDYEISHSHFRQIESIAEFLERSSPPLPDFVLQYYTSEEGPIPRFERLPGITSLFLISGSSRWPPNHVRLENFLRALVQPPDYPILPRLKALTFKLHHLDFSAVSWTLMGDLFPKDTPNHPADVEATRGTTSIATRRPLSELNIRLQNNDDRLLPMLYNTSLLRLLEVKRSGVDLVVDDENLGDLLGYMAEVYGIEL